MHLRQNGTRDESTARPCWRHGPFIPSVSRIVVYDVHTLPPPALPAKHAGCQRLVLIGHAEQLLFADELRLQVGVRPHLPPVGRTVTHVHVWSV